MSVQELAHEVVVNATLEAEGALREWLGRCERCYAAYAVTPATRARWLHTLQTECYRELHDFAAHEMLRLAAAAQRKLTKTAPPIPGGRPAG